MSTTELPQLLLAEDSETSAAIILRQLQDKFAVLHARDGLQAWELLTAHPGIELVITDIQMPNMTGHELLRKIRASDSAALRNLPVIALTGAADSADRNLAFTNGANDFLIKPVDAIELEARVRVHQKLSRTIRELEASRSYLREQATNDPLTQLKNRRAFLDAGTRQFSLARRHTNELSIAVLELDRFREMNDTHGRAAGDAVLTALAHLLTAGMRLEDIAARIDNTTFAILLPHTSRLGAAVLAERLRHRIEQHRFDAAGKSLSLTASIGVAAFGVDGKDNVEQLINVAERRLDAAKQNGGNRIAVSDGDNSG